MFPAPPAPVFLPDQSITIERPLRYEDCTQDGRLTTLAIPPTLSILFQHVMRGHPGARNALASGALSLLTRLTVESVDTPIRVQRPALPTVGFELAHDRDAAGEVSRVFMNVWSEVRGVPGRASRSAPRPTRRDPVIAGRAFAEHTFTRPFAPPDQRRVTSLAGIDGYPTVPPTRYAQPAPVSAAAAPGGATWLDELTADPVDVRFMLDQTDANQHVNSMVYVRYFLDAVQRRLAAGGHPANLRSKAFDIAYRKPSFVGERARAHVRLFARGDHVGGAGFIAGPGEEARPRCYVRAVFGP